MASTVERLPPFSSERGCTVWASKPIAWSSFLLGRGTVIESLTIDGAGSAFKMADFSDKVKQLSRLEPNKRCAECNARVSRRLAVPCAALCRVARNCVRAILWGATDYLFLFLFLLFDALQGANYVDLTTHSFVCTACGGMLRGLTPPHRLKGCSMAKFSKEEAIELKAKGNAHNKEQWLAGWDTHNDEVPDKEAVRLCRATFAQLCVQWVCQLMPARGTGTSCRVLSFWARVGGIPSRRVSHQSAALLPSKRRGGGGGGGGGGAFPRGLRGLRGLRHGLLDTHLHAVHCKRRAAVA